MAWRLGGGRCTRLAWFPKELAGVRAGGRSSQIHRRCNREANEKRQLIRIVVHHVDSHRQSLHHFYETARRVLRRQRGQRGAGTLGETRNPPLEDMFLSFRRHPRIKRSEAYIPFLTNSGTRVSIWIELEEKRRRIADRSGKWFGSHSETPALGFGRTSV